MSVSYTNISVEIPTLFLPHFKFQLWEKIHLVNQITIIILPLHSNSFYTVLIICKYFLYSDMLSSISQNFILFSAILAKVTCPSI